MEKLYRSNGNSLCIYCTSLPYTLTLIFFLLFTITSQAQVIKNAYAKVKTVATVSGKSQLTITNENTTNHPWAVNEEVIVIQMQDNVISGTSNDNLFGLLSGIGNAGAFEVAVISSYIPGTPNSTMTLNKVLTRPFNTGNNAKVQVVSFTSLSSGNYPTTADITALAWDSTKGTGGIVAISVGGTLTLKHAITVDGKGFAGGPASSNSNVSCNLNTNYTGTATTYGAKGEGIYSVNTAVNSGFLRGRARLLSGGGGGNSSGSGGAGGSNFSAGGDGAKDPDCLFSSSGAGLGGVPLSLYMLTGTRAFMGGGGGGGQGSGNQTKGGNGGGIIFIKAAALTTSCGSPKISANGNAAGSSGDDGAGGGGAAGTIVLQIGTYTATSSCSLNVQANGGNGGDAGGFGTWGGGGGGGGQGAVLISGSPAMNHVSPITVPGSGGSTGFLTGDAPDAGGNSSDGVQGGIGVVLPVRLLYFASDNKNNKAVLTWTSADENNVLYTIERSADGNNFTAIGQVAGTGQSNYTYTDPTPINGRVYYRLLLMGDITAKTTYSSIVNVNQNNVAQVAVAYPNPAHDYFYIRITADNTNKPYKVAVTDLAGQVVYTTTGIPANNIMKVTPGKVLKPGLYIFKVTGDGFEQSGKLMIR